MPVKFKPWPRNMHEKAAHAVSFVLVGSTCFSEQADDMSVSQNGTLEQDILWEFWDLTSKDHRRPSALQVMEELYQPYGLAVLSDVRAVQKRLKNSLATLRSAIKDGRHW